MIDRYIYIGYDMIYICVCMFVSFSELFEMINTLEDSRFSEPDGLMLWFRWFSGFQLGDSFPISLAPPGSSLELAPGSTLAEIKREFHVESFMLSRWQKWVYLKQKLLKMVLNSFPTKTLGRELVVPQLCGGYGVILGKFAIGLAQARNWSGLLPLKHQPLCFCRSQVLWTSQTWPCQRCQ